jgi:hypothetical protein
MTARSEEAKAELREAEQKLADAKAELKEAEQKLADAKAELKEAETQQEQVEQKLMETKQADPVNTAEIQRLEQKLQRMRTELSQLQSSLISKHASVLSKEESVRSKEEVIRRLESQLPMIAGIALAPAGAASTGPQPLSEDDPFLAFWRSLADDQVQLTRATLMPPSPAPVAGQLMTLPLGANLFGRYALGNKLYVRPCYPKLHAAISAYLSSDMRSNGALVTGNPGVGKTFFMVFLLHYYKKQRVTVVFEDQKRDLRYLLPPTAGSERKGSAGSMDFDDVLDQRLTIYLFDCGGANKPEPKTCNASTIVVSSPDPVHYGDWVKDKRKFTMPVWTAEECTAVVPAIYPRRLLPDGSDEYAARFNLHGGIARTIFSQESWQTLKSELDSAISGCNLSAVLDSVDRSEKLSGATHRLLHYFVDESNYVERTLNFATDDICDRVMERQEKDHWDGVVSFLLGAQGRADLGGVRGKIFERHAHAVLARGGEFRGRWESDEKHEDHTIHFNARQQRGIVADLSVLGDHVSRSHGSCHSLTMYEMWRSTSFALISGVCVCVCVSVCVCVCVCVYACVRDGAGLRSSAQDQLSDHRCSSQTPAPVSDDCVVDALHQLQRAPTGSYGTRLGAQAVHSILRRAAGHLPKLREPVHGAYWDHSA